MPALKFVPKSCQADRFVPSMHDSAVRAYCHTQVVESQRAATADYTGDLAAPALLSMTMGSSRPPELPASRSFGKAVTAISSKWVVPLGNHSAK